MSKKPEIEASICNAEDFDPTSEYALEVMRDARVRRQALEGINVELERIFKCKPGSLINGSGRNES
jgi:putative component of membrane protein insertase Oxa1/YidC/SpoIIIJ protein YidD